MPRHSATHPSGLSRRRLRALLGLAVGGSMLLTGCQGTDDGGAGGTTTVHEGLTKAGTWPLTGRPAGGTTPRHPVMVVKIDNSVSSQPQIGLAAADLVTEELVEGGSTRLAVFYYQRVPRLVGPVRSMRATDIGIVKPAKAVLVASGGAPPTVARIKAAGITTYTEGATGYRRDTARRAPYNLFMGLKELARTTKARSTVSSYLPFGRAADLPRGRRARGLAATFSGTQTTRWTYQGGRYVNANSFAEQGDRFRPDNVLVLRVQVGDAGYLDPAGNHVPETKFTGSGAAMLFHGGRVVRGTWTKTLDTPLSLRTASGRLPVPVGHTWIELVPKNGGRVDVTR
jgi:hypothetical protein